MEGWKNAKKASEDIANWKEISKPKSNIPSISKRPLTVNL